MSFPDHAPWSEHLQQTLERYDEDLLRQVAARLFKPRNQWPVDELIERSLDTVRNAAVIDRRLQDLEPAGRKVLALFAHSRQPRWKLGSLLEMLAALGHAEGPKPIFDLFEAGLLYPDLPDGIGRLRSFEQWLGQAASIGFTVFAHPLVSARALGEDLGLPDLGTESAVTGPPQESDGLEWPLRLAILWQLADTASFRLTQQQDFFKRDLDRLRQDALLGAAPADALAELPDPGLLTATLARLGGLLQEKDGELRAGTLPSGENALLPALENLFTLLPRLETWNFLDGWRGGQATGSPYPSACLLALLLLARLPKDGWASPHALEEWVREHHPYWSAEDSRPSKERSWLGAFLLGFAYQLRLVQAARDADGDWVVRLGPVGRWLLGLGEAPHTPATFPRTLLVQPNLEIIAYRQGLTPGLIGQLSKLATWKNLGPACLLQLEPASVYRALQSGLSFETMLQALERHGTRQVPPAVVDSLRTWAAKRDRLTIYPAATLFEFATAEDLKEALARGLPGVRLSERMAVVASESEVDFRHFRLTGTRDYSLPPEKCVEVDDDGVTLAIDLARSDLLVETEVQRFAEVLDRPSSNGRRLYRVSPGTAAAARSGGLTLRQFEDWFSQRTGQPVSAAARLLLLGGQVPVPELRHTLTLHVATAEVADGLQQWPNTRLLIQARLGPTVLAVAEDQADALREQLRLLGISLAPSAV